MGQRHSSENTTKCWCNYNSKEHPYCIFCKKKHYIDPCIICGDVIHAPTQCTFLCPCANIVTNDNNGHGDRCISMFNNNIHKKNEHVCRICDEVHLEQDCRNRCQCYSGGYIHSIKNHKCFFCGERHQDNDCSIDKKIRDEKMETQRIKERTWLYVQAMPDQYVASNDN